MSERDVTQPLQFPVFAVALRPFVFTEDAKVLDLPQTTFCVRETDDGFAWLPIFQTALTAAKFMSRLNLGVDVTFALIENEMTLTRIVQSISKLRNEKVRALFEPDLLL